MVQLSAGPQAFLTPLSLYRAWTGDGLAGVKQAERVAWSLENAIVLAELEPQTRWGSECDLAKLFGVGLGVAREALSIVELRGACLAKKGPGGGIFVSRPSADMAAQSVVNYLVRVGVTHDHVAEGRLLLDQVTPEAAHSNASFQLFARCLSHLDQRLDAGESDVAWRHYTSTSLSTAHRVGWKIADAVLQIERGGDGRIGSEDQLCERYNVSRSSMRQAVRLLETSGIIESRPGRNQGLFASRPCATPIIRRLTSYMLAVRLPASHCQHATSLFGEAVLGSLIADSAPHFTAQAVEEIAHIRTADRRNRANASRTALQIVMEQVSNPLLALFWRSMAGYTFRAFAGAKALSAEMDQSLDSHIIGILQAALDQDAAGGVSAFRDILPASPVHDWAIRPE